MDSPAFRFSIPFNSTIWKVVADARNGLMVLELRDLESQDIQFAQMNIKTGESTLFKIASADLWTVLIAYEHPKLVLEQFIDPQNPNSKRLILFDVLSEKTEKEIEGFQFTNLENGLLKGYNLESRNEEEYNLDVIPSENRKALISPTYFAADSESAQSVMEYLSLEKSGIGFEYYEGQNWIIICYYERLGTNFDRSLVLIKNEEEVLRRKIDKEMTGFASGAFFIFDDFLIFIEHRNHLHAIEL